MGLSLSALHKNIPGIQIAFVAVDFLEVAIYSINCYSPLSTQVVMTAQYGILFSVLWHPTIVTFPAYTTQELRPMIIHKNAIALSTDNVE